MEKWFNGWNKDMSGFHVEWMKKFGHHLYEEEYGSSEDEESEEDYDEEQEGKQEEEIKEEEATDGKHYG